MIKKLKQKHSTKLAALLSVVLVAAMIMTGTLAWQSISQQVTNEQVLDTVVGGRLHDDFDGKNKDIYAENYTTKNENGEPLYVRVRLMEYMEIGEDAGINTEQQDRKVDILIDGADINDPDTWEVHKPEAEDPTVCATTPSFHDYWLWELGGDTVYLPTFNKNNESLEVDVNGTWESIGVDGKHYSDHEDYTVGDTVTAMAQYSANSAVNGTPATGSDGSPCIEVEEEHTAKKTQTATVITMQEWLDNGAVPGKFWVWDTDGWAYWAEALQPEEATGCLLTGIQQKIYVTGNLHYEIHVDSEFATAFDWGTEGDGENHSGGDGFYEKGMTENGKNLLDRIASIVEDEAGNRYVSCGNNIYKRIFDNGTLGDAICAGEDLKIGTSDDRTDVIELEEDLIINGVNYGKVFLGPGANKTYWAVGVDNLLGTEDDTKIWYLGSEDFPGNPVVPENFSFKGADELELTGLTDGIEVEASQRISDITTSVKLNGEAIENQAVIWTIKGNTSADTKFDASTGTLIIGADETAGELTITVKSDEDKNAKVTLKVNVMGPESVSITSGGTEVTTQQVVSQGNSQTFVAAVKGKSGATYSNDQVTWKLSGNTKSGTKLVNGKLTVASDEPGDTILTITATAVNDTTVSKTIEVKVKLVSKFDNVTAGSTTTASIDGMDWYVLAKDGDKTLIWAKQGINNNTKYEFGSSNTWSTSCTAYTTLKSWLNGTSTLKSKAVETTIYTSASYDRSSTAVSTMNCKVFLLSEADVFGTANNKAVTNKQEYTYNNARLVTNSTVIKGDELITWLRSPRTRSSYVASVKANGDSSGNYCGNVYVLRPALWVEGL